jgi:hypothetical protein
MPRALIRAITCAIIPMAACRERPATTANHADDARRETAAITPANGNHVQENGTAAPSPVLGLLRFHPGSDPLPATCGERVAMPLHAEPREQSPIGSVMVRTWCRSPTEPDSVRFVATVGAQALELPTREIGYEEPAAIVLGVADRGWYRIQLSDSAAAWVHASDPRQFQPITSLLAEALTFLTDAWDGRLASAPDAPLLSPMLSPTLGGATSGRPVRVRGFQDVNRRTWVQVDVLTSSACEEAGTPQVLATGWLPLHAPSGAPTVWFRSRGC